MKLKIFLLFILLYVSASAQSYDLVSNTETITITKINSFSAHNTFNLISVRDSIMIISSGEMIRLIPYHKSASHLIYKGLYLTCADKIDRVHIYLKKNIVTKIAILCENYTIEYTK